ncbi:spore germination protein [Paenibacillus rhizophilus]|uniref:Spore germination protein n=1 Tax=Paenibacillus rhizophilus TaxID=1850366 RepID=A0A3N9PS51_9BACL|nr:spore germination protein [Paenibacillus rhizophilus]RQW09152.1 spore germination protein [Paenibacillus rhizophilus]
MEYRTPPNNELVSGEIALDLGMLRTTFERSSDVVFREFQLGDTQAAVMIFLDGMVDPLIVDSDIMQPLLKYGEQMQQKSGVSLTGLESLLKNQVITASQVNTGGQIQDVIDHILVGDTVLLIDGVNKALFISARGWGKRAVEEPATEAVIRGPREGFTEDLLTNITLIRRRLRTPQLKIEGMQLGRLSKTDVAITYLEGIADEAVIEEVRKRMNRIDIDAILESGYVEELIEDSPFSIFPQINYTERPDRIVGNLLEGKVGILIDNTPFALILPVTFFEMMQASEDYYQRYIVSTLIRLLRYMFLVIALLLPSLYIALLTFHQEMLPTSLLLSAAASREAVPFPAIVEALLMEISFEALREAGVRLPRPVGQAVSIVGALVIGEAAVSAGIVSAPMVIIVSITGIASFIVPSYSQAITIRLLRFPMMIMAGTLGLYGVLLGVLFILIHMSRLRSFGVPYLSPLAPLHASDLKDVLIRVPWWGMVRRSTETAKNNPRRMKGTLRPRPPKRGG